MSEEQPGSFSPGCITFLTDLAVKYNDKLIFFVYYLGVLDRMGIYGSKAYKLWNDCCGRDLVIVENIILNFAKGNLSKEVIYENLSRQYAMLFEGLEPLADRLVEIFESEYSEVESNVNNGNQS